MLIFLTSESIKPCHLTPQLRKLVSIFLLILGLACSCIITFAISHINHYVLTRIYCRLNEIILCITAEKLKQIKNKKLIEIAERASFSFRRLQSRLCLLMKFS